MPEQTFATEPPVGTIVTDRDGELWPGVGAAVLRLAAGALVDAAEAGPWLTSIP